MALSRPIGWLRDQRGDAVGLATADPLFQGGETKPTGYVATYSPVFTAEQVQQESKETSMAKFKGRKLKHGGIDRPPTPNPCVACNGSGRYDSTGSPKCGACNGTGEQASKEVCDAYQNR